MALENALGSEAAHFTQRLQSNCSTNDCLTFKMRRKFKSWRSLHWTTNSASPLSFLLSPPWQPILFDARQRQYCQKTCSSCRLRHHLGKRASHSLRRRRDDRMAIALSKNGPIIRNINISVALTQELTRMRSTFRPRKSSIFWDPLWLWLLDSGPLWGLGPGPGTPLDSIVQFEPGLTLLQRH